MADPSVADPPDEAPLQTGGALDQNFAALLSQTTGGSVNPTQLPPAIAPLDLGSAQRLSFYAGTSGPAPPTAPLDKPMPNYSDASTGPLPPELRGEYSHAVMQGQTSGPQHFAEHLTGAAWGAVDDQMPPTATDTHSDRSALSAGTAGAIAGTLPRIEDLIDYSAGIAHAATGKVTSDAVDVVKQNMLDHWTATGEPLSHIYGKALTDSAFRDQMANPKPVPLPPLTDEELAKWQAAQTQSAEPGIHDPLGDLGTKFQGNFLSELLRPVGLEGAANAVKETAYGMTQTAAGDVDKLGGLFGHPTLGQDLLGIMNSGALVELGLPKWPDVGMLDHGAIAGALRETATNESGAGPNFFIRPAKAVAEGAEGAEEPTGPIRHSVTDQSGKEVATALIEDQGAGEHYVHSIRATGEGVTGYGQANALGPRAIRDIATDYAKQHPDAQGLSGFRVTGARTAEGQEGAGMMRVALDRFRSMAQNESGAGPNPVQAIRNRLQKTYSPAMNAGIRGLFNWFKPGEGADYGRQSITAETGIGNRLKAAAAQSLDQFRLAVNQQMPEWRQYLQDRAQNYAAVQQAKAAWIKQGGNPKKFSPVNPVGPPVPKPVIGQLFDYMEGRSTGAKFPADHPLYPLADTLREVMEDIKAEMAKMFPKMEGPEGWVGLNGFKEDYVHHLWKHPDLARNVYASGRQGDASAFRARKIPTISEGLDAGLEPALPNPIDLALRYVHGVQDFLASERIRRNIRADGLAKYRLDGANVPEAEAGWMPLKGRSAEMSGPKVGGPMLRLYAPPGLAIVYNRWLGKGFYAYPKLGKVFDAVRNTTNASLALNLGLSGFHLTNIAFATAASKLASAMDAGFHGQLGLALKHLAEPFQAALPMLARDAQGNWVLQPRGLGSRMTRAFLDPKDTTDPYAQNLASIAARSGLRLGGRGAEYSLSSLPNLFQSWRRGSLKEEFNNAPGKFVATALQRALDVPMSPMFDEMIPHLKASAWGDMMTNWLRRNPLASEERVVAQGQYLTRAMDNRFGEMNQDMLFWPRAAKQAINAATVSLGWEYGTLRALGNGVREAFPVGSKGAANLQYLIAYPLILSLASSLYMHLKTGHTPLDAKTLGGKATLAATPWSGGTDEQGGMQLVRPPSESSVVEALYHQYQLGMSDPTWFMRSRLNGVAGVFSDFIQGQFGDFFNAGGSRLLDNMVHAVTPISLQQILHHPKGQNINWWERVGGWSAAPVWWAEAKKWEAQQQKKLLREEAIRAAYQRKDKANEE